MSDLKDIRKIVGLFKQYYKAVNKIDYFVFKMTPNKQKVIINFCTELKKITKSELQDDYLKSFFDFQFNRWYKRDMPNGKGVSIQIEWIVGKKALDLWLKADKVKMAFVVRKNFKKDVTFERTIEKEDYRNVLVETNVVEESDKGRFFGSNLGFSYCQIATTLFNHKSELCGKCKSSKKCKELLSVDFPKIYKLRGYVGE